MRDARFIPAPPALQQAVLNARSLFFLLKLPTQLLKLIKINESTLATNQGGFMTSAVTTSAPLLQPEILEFAQRNGVGAYLAPVLAMTMSIFPQALAVDLMIEEDLEIPSDAHLLLRVCLPCMDAEQYVTSKFKWSEELFRICPSPVVCVFRYRARSFKVSSFSLQIP
jgi:hypothetical protein